MQVKPATVPRMQAGARTLQLVETSDTLPTTSNNVPPVSVAQVGAVSQTFVSEREECPALQELSFSVADGEFVSLVGPSGCAAVTMPTEC